MSNTDGQDDQGEVVSVTAKGQATIPKQLREKHGINTPGKVRIRETDEGAIVVEPVPSIREFRGSASSSRRGTAILAEERRRDAERADRLGAGSDPRE